MLCQFSFQNFKSYKKETTFDFQASVLPEFKDTLIDADKAVSIVPVSVVYGPNAGGKSNLLHALSCVISTIGKKSEWAHSSAESRCRSVSLRRDIKK